MLYIIPKVGIQMQMAPPARHLSSAFWCNESALLFLAAASVVVLLLHTVSLTRFWFLFVVWGLASAWIDAKRPGWLAGGTPNLEQEAAVFPFLRLVSGPKH
jgi:hypothetical protein